MKTNSYWIIRNERGEAFPHSFAIHRPLCIKRFIETPTYGYGGAWPTWRGKGFEAVRCKLEFIFTPITD